MRPLIVALLVFIACVGYGQPMMQAKKASSADIKKLQTLEKNYNVAKAALTKKPKDAATRKKFVEAGVKFGHESMVGPVLSAKVKYRQALRVYREVLKVDPKNKVAKQESELIIRIYKSMGRPVPDN